MGREGWSAAVSAAHAIGIAANKDPGGGQDPCSRKAGVVAQLPDLPDVPEAAVLPDLSVRHLSNSCWNCLRRSLRHS